MSRKEERVRSTFSNIIVLKGVSSQFLQRSHSDQSLKSKSVVIDTKYSELDTDKTTSKTVSVQKEYLYSLNSSINQSI
jgi:hypothetical protein